MNTQGVNIHYFVYDEGVRMVGQLAPAAVIYPGGGQTSVTVCDGARELCVDHSSVMIGLSLCLA